MIDRVVSGGQTGVDRAALDAALDRGLACGGWCPRGRRAEGGAIPRRYPLMETESADYRVRTQRNVTDSDGTLILLTGDLSGGTALTREIALTERKPVLTVDLGRAAPVSEIREWIRRNKIRTLNVAGPRESQRPGIYSRARDLLLELFADAGTDTGRPARFQSGGRKRDVGDE